MAVLPDDDWQECEPGALAEVVSTLKTQTVARRAQRRTVVGLGLVTCGFLAIYGMLDVMGGGDPVDLVCADVVRLADDYLAGRLDHNDRDSVESHLSHCIRCREHFDHIRESKPGAWPTPESGSLPSFTPNLVGRL